MVWSIKPQEIKGLGFRGYVDEQRVSCISIPAAYGFTLLPFLHAGDGRTCDDYSGRFQSLDFWSVDSW